MIFNILKANAAIKALTEEAGKLTESLKVKDAELVTANGQVATLTNEKAELHKQIETLTAQLADASKSANHKAAEIVANIGVTEPVKEAAAQPTLAEVTEQLAALQKSDPKAAAELYNQFRSQFLTK